ncbi:SRPBCC domain-containing protein [Kutzneria buriramensis]|uniref:Activator of Hsp90 ATPase-like protein n=1 Tax=Kutzneria buriramensis TaxID=1045776 RepID=A0A3E0HLG8_9PSEU|nr:SRPBCC domain-containing protein [Kutzneria buriramensis]REH47200.1 activator of Hsp90 ATPase-like protein [Kutzneria buriramensis]
MNDDEIVIAGTPEQVWEAITTAKGSAAWSFRMDVEPRVGGAVRIGREPFAGETEATVSAWEPPTRFGYRDETFATEFLVTARDQGSCVVRVVSSLQTDGEGWDEIAEEAAAGWRMTLQVLRTYVTHFAGQPAAKVDLIVPVKAPPTARAEIGERLAGELGIGDNTCDGPLISGEVDHRGPYFALVRTKKPGMFAVSCFPMDAVTLSINVTGRLYGPEAEARAIKERRRWREWLNGFVETI